MPFDLESAIAVRERDDGLLEKDTFDLASAMPVDDTLIFSTGDVAADFDRAGIKQGPKFQEVKQQPNWVLSTLDEANKQMQDLLTMPARLLGTPHPAMVSGLTTETIPGMVKWLTEKEFSGYNTLIKEQDATPEQKQYSQPAQNRPGFLEIAGERPRWESLVEKGANLVVIGYGIKQGYQFIKNELEIRNLARKVDSVANRMADEVLTHFPKSSRVRAEGLVTEQEAGWLKERANIVEGFKVSILNKLSAFEQVGGKWQPVAEGAKNRNMFSLVLNELRAMGESGQAMIKRPAINDVVSFTNPKGELLTGIIRSITGQRAEIDMAGRMVVATLNQLSLPKIEQPAEGKVALTEAEQNIADEIDTLTKKDLRIDPRNGRSKMDDIEGMIDPGSPLEKIFKDKINKLEGKKAVKPKVDKWQYGAEPAAAIPGEPIAFYDVKDKNFDTAKAHIIYDEIDNQPLGYKVVLQNGQELANPKSDKIGGSPYFDTLEEAQKFTEQKLSSPTGEGQTRKESIKAITDKITSGELSLEDANKQLKQYGVQVGDVQNPLKPKQQARMRELALEANKEYHKSISGEGQKPPVEPPKTAVSGEPAPESNKLFKDYVRATPIGKVISKPADIKQELANEDFLIKSYEGDISKLENQIKVEQFNTEAEKLKAQDKLVALKDKYALAKETQRQKKAYRDEVAGLVKSITATPKENIAIEYQDMIEQLQSKFDLKRRTEATEAKREGMKAFVERMKVEGKAIDIPEAKLAMLDKLTLNDMTLDQLREVSSTIKNLEKLGKTKLKARVAVYTATKEKAKTELLGTTTPINSKELAKLPIGEKYNTWVKKAIEIQNAVQKTGVGLTPIDGLADVTGMGKMKDILDKDFSKYLTHNDKAIEEWYNLTKDFTDKEFERIGVVAASRQEGGLERLANSGITEAEVKAIKLTPEEEKAYKFVVDTFDKEYPAVKQYSKEVYNADVGQQENYVSFMSDYEQMSDLEIYQRFGQTPEQIATRRTKTVEQGFTKERTELSKIKLETNIDKIFRRHLDDVAYMLNTGKNIKMYFEIVNSPEMREKLGDVGTLAWLQYLDLMARKGGVEGAKRIAALDILRKNIGAGVLSFRLSSALVQFSSFADTIATIGAEWATKGATAISSKEWRNFIMDNFPEIKKAIGDDIAFREFGEGALAKLANVGLKPLQFLDGLMRSTASAGSYQKLAAEKGIVIDLKNPNADLIAEATKLMRNSQGSSFFKDQPLAITAGYGLTDNRSVNKLLLTFQSFMLNRWDNINRQIYRLGIKEKDYGKAISSVFWLLIFAGAVEEGIRRGTRKIISTQMKEDSFVKNSLMNILQSVPLVGQLVTAVSYSSNPVPVIKTMDDLLEGVGSTIKSKAIETKLRGLVRAIGAAGSLFGLAGSSQVAQILRDRIPKANKKKTYW